ncbi:MAG: AmmeMemoRadiSam system radical SAM enzyme [Bacteroidales bacterium]|nr:AmmeMemoRadiSam system radical SAM enzyme [Bacteroidales bacterium]MCF8402865.1 AmmeMemoRadiSam system radical SAM enzyme [Bacteroidales bacterium]
MKEALFYRQENEKVKCLLCPHICIIPQGKRGSCFVRKNENGILYSENYEKPCSLSFDPIEKKPLYHFYPGKLIFSVGSLGCNLHCKFCQNWQISQTGIEEFGHIKMATAKEIVSLARQKKENIGIAYTYNEPTVWYEYMFDIAQLACQENLKNAMVTNGFINPDPLAQLLPYMHAFNVDLKSFNDSFYKKFTRARLRPVLETLKTIRKSGRHLEITHLVISNTNDSKVEFKKMIDWISNELGSETIMHISKYYPVYKFTEPRTRDNVMFDFFDIASKKLAYVYLGNMASEKGQNTYCKNCKEEVISRSGYHTQTAGITDTGKCKLCQETILLF